MTERGKPFVRKSDLDEYMLGPAEKYYTTGLKFFSIIYDTDIAADYAEMIQEIREKAEKGVGVEKLCTMYHIQQSSCAEVLSGKCSKNVRYMLDALAENNRLKGWTIMVN